MKYLNKYIVFKENFDLDYYDQGACEVFMLALHEELGYDMYLYIDNEASFYTDDEITYHPALIHAFTKNDKDELFDVNGKIHLENLEEHSDEINDGEIIKIDRNELDNYISTHFLAPINKTQLKECRLYIRNNKSKYL